LTLPRTAITSREILALALILLAAVVVRWPGVTGSLWFDEVWYTQTTFTDPVMLANVLWKDVHPPAYPLLLMAWTDLFGDSEISVRMPSFLCALASLVLLWLIARRWLGQGMALLVAALLALSPPHIWYSGENKVNMLLLLLTTASVWLFWRASETRRTNDWIIATCVLVAALFTHSYAVPVAAAIYAWLFWRATGDRSLFKPVLVSGAVIALAFTPLALMKFGQRSDLSRGYLRQLGLAELYELFLIWLPNGNTFRTGNPGGGFSRLLAQPVYLFLAEALYALVLLRGLLTIGRKARGDGWLKPFAGGTDAGPARLMLLWILVPLALTVVGSLFSENFYIERNLLVILPPFLLVLAAGTETRSPRWMPAALSAVLVLLASASVLSLRFIHSEKWTVYKYKPDWRSAARYLAEDAGGSGRAKVLVTIPTFEYQYYQRRNEPAPAGAGPAPYVISVCNDQPEATLRQLTQLDWPAFYLVHNSTWNGCWKDIWNALPSVPSLQIVDQREFKGLTVYKIRASR
jgi:4-amino-4-deoxy-L-arabinose transferase-like glycosyltransferase